MKIAVQLHPQNGKPQSVEYRWDADTEILSAQLLPRGTGEGMSGSLGLEGADGSWLIFDVADGCVSSVEVAVWPQVRTLGTLSSPAVVEEAQVVVPLRKSQPDIASLEMSTHLIADANPNQSTIHFSLGKGRGTRTIRLARDLLLDVDDKSQISGLWMLNVPPRPAEL